MFRPRVLTARPSIFSWSTRAFSSADWRDLLFFAISVSDSGLYLPGREQNISIYRAAIGSGFQIPRHLKKISVIIAYYHLFHVATRTRQRGHRSLPEILSMTLPSSPSTAKRIASLVTAINVLVAGGFSIAGLVSPKSILPAGYAPTDASFIFAMYAAARSIPLAFMVLIAIYKQLEAALLILGVLAGFIQLLDAGVGLLQHDLGKAVGPLVIAAFQFFAIYLLSRSARGNPE